MTHFRHHKAAQLAIAIQVADRLRGKAARRPVRRTCADRRGPVRATVRHRTRRRRGLLARGEEIVVAHLSRGRESNIAERPDRRRSPTRHGIHAERPRRGCRRRDRPGNLRAINRDNAGPSIILDGEVAGAIR